MGRTKTIGDDEILKRARAVFREGGHAASTREVARAVGLSQAVLYQRFGSKEELFARAMFPDTPDLDGLLGGYPPEDVQADLARIGERLAGYLAAHMATFIHVLAHPGDGRDRLVEVHQRQAFRPLLSGLEDRFRRLRDDGLVGDVDPVAAARTFLAAVHAAALFQAMAHGSGHGPQHAHIEALVNVLWVGLAPGGAHPAPAATEAGR
ncbi:MAG TPA: TetR/AcrR family transcriptional regulator [Longimicrobiales bacterium]|nr:TetR/AcrR family transcriptional regulator [Longimicrobiales bacterium]